MEETCPICLENEATIKTPCNHSFCSNCLIQQANTEIPKKISIVCAYCRGPFNPFNVIFKDNIDTRKESLSKCPYLKSEEVDILSKYQFICTASLSQYFEHRDPQLDVVRPDEELLYCLTCESCFYINPKRLDSMLVNILKIHGDSCKPIAERIWAFYQPILF